MSHYLSHVDVRALLDVFPRSALARTVDLLTSFTNSTVVVKCHFKSKHLPGGHGYHLCYLQLTVNNKPLVLSADNKQI